MRGYLSCTEFGLMILIRLLENHQITDTNVLRDIVCYKRMAGHESRSVTVTFIITLVVE